MDRRLLRVHADRLSSERSALVFPAPMGKMSGMEAMAQRSAFSQLRHGEVAAWLAEQLGSPML